MKRNQSLILSLILGLLIVLVLFYRTKSPNRNNWFVTFSENGTQPYDIHIFSNALKNHSDLSVESPSLPPVVDEYEYLEKRSFILIDNHLELNAERLEDLEELALLGHDVFIMGNHIDLEEMSLMFSSYATSQFKYDSVYINNDEQIVSKQPLRHWNMGWRTYGAQIFTDEFINNSNATIELKANDQPIWVSIQNEGYEGTIHLLSFPLIYSNFYLKQDPELNILDHFISSIKNTEVLYYPGASETFSARKIKSTQLSFIQQNEALYMAAIILLIFLGLYLFFAGKRKQQSVPQKVEEESSFVLTSKFIGPYYNSNNRVQNLEKKLIYQFDSLIYATYGINLQNCSSEEVSFVANKLNVEAEEVQEIQYTLKMIHEVSKKDFLILHNKITRILNQWKK